MKLMIVPSYVISESETERSKEWRDLRDFKYGCVGYSVFLDNEGSLTNEPDKQIELPVCVGLEVFPLFFALLMDA